MRKIIMPAILLLSLLIINRPVYARDTEFWTQETFTLPINKSVDFLILPEWRFKNDMHDHYLFKLETGPSFKINKYLEIATYYAYQEKKSNNLWDKSDLAYLDGALRLTFKELFDIKLSNRLRYQYDFDKAKTTLRNAAKLSKDFNMGKQKITPYISEEPFYDEKLHRITEHRTSSGITLGLSKNISLSIGYMLNSKKGNSKWTYADVLISNVNIKF